MKSRIKKSTQEQFGQTAHEIFDRYQNGEKLSELEIQFLCSATPPIDRGGLDICREYYFRDLYFMETGNIPSPFGRTISETERVELWKMAAEWHDYVKKHQNGKSKVLRQVYKELTKEIKLMEVEFQHNGFLVRGFLYQAKLRKILWMSRFVHFKVTHDIFLGYDTKEFLIDSTFGPVVYDSTALVHILIRHYAAGQKQYSPVQSFFSKDVMISSLHRLLTLVLGHIKKNGIKIKQPLNKAISFKYKQEYYQMYLSVEKKTSVYIVKTIFPVNDHKIINSIKTLNAHVISKTLTIYEQ